MKPELRILVPENERKITFVSAQRKGSREGKNTTIFRNIQRHFQRLGEFGLEVTLESLKIPA